eukprot:SAG31_NODE_13703_length_852_cov_1.316069_1_plen_251_part_01
MPTFLKNVTARRPARRAPNRIALQLSPDTPDAPFNLGVSLIAMGGAPAFEEASTIWRQQVAANPAFASRLVNQDPTYVVDELAREESALAMVLDQVDPDIDSGTSGIGKLRSVIASLRAVENDVSKVVTRFKSIFWVAENEQRPTEQIDQKSLAYGSTYFHSWLRVAVEPVVSEALHRAAGATETATPSLPAPVASRGLVVLGSSIGWFAFFGHLLYNVPSMGYDLLCTDVEEAQATAEEHGIDSDPRNGV